MDKWEILSLQKDVSDLQFAIQFLLRCTEKTEDELNIFGFKKGRLKSLLSDRISKKIAKLNVPKSEGGS